PCAASGPTRQARFMSALIPSPPSTRSRPMTAEIELLPLPKWMSNYTIPSYSSVYDEDVILADRMHDYARANVAVATATLQAEIEALRAEVEAWRELSDHVRAGACKAIWPERYTDER